MFGACNSDMKAEACAMHIVYMEDLVGSVQRIFDYILSSPDVYHQGYHQGLVDQVNRLASYVHDKEESTGPMVGNMPRDFDCSSSSQRLNSNPNDFVRILERKYQIKVKDDFLSWIIAECFNPCKSNM